MGCKMTKRLTVKELATAVLGGDKGEALLSLTRQIDHWTVTGIYEAVDAGPGDVHVGRGKPRRYPPKALYWTALFYHLARRGALVVNMRSVAHSLTRPKNRVLVERAMQGKRPSGFMVLSFDKSLTIQYCVGELSIDSLGPSGSFFDLTRIFDSVRDAARRAENAAA